MLKWGLSVACVLVLSAAGPAWAGGNGGSRGGGNGLVCFDDPSIADSLGGDSRRAVEIPEPLRKHISRISILDWEETGQDARGWKKGMILPAHDVVSPVEMPRADLYALLDEEYDRLISRYDGAMPDVFAKLKEARKVLPLAGLKLQDRVDQISDFVQFTSEPGCVVSTIFNQWRADDGSYRWAADAGLFFNAAQSFASMVATILHERAYWAGRDRMVVNIDAGATYFFAAATLEANTPYREARRHYNNMFLDSDRSSFSSALTSGPMLWFTRDFLPRFKAALAASGNRLATRAERKAALALYDAGFRAEALAYPKISLKMRDEMDQNIRRWIQDKPVSNPFAWPADFEASPPPLPAGAQVERRK